MVVITLFPIKSEENIHVQKRKFLSIPSENQGFVDIFKLEFSFPNFFGVFF